MAATRLSYDVPGDAYYKEQIKTLQRKLDDLNTRTDLQAEYIRDLEESNRNLMERVDHLRNKLADILEGRHV